MMTYHLPSPKIFISKYLCCLLLFTMDKRKLFSDEFYSKLPDEYRKALEKLENELPQGRIRCSRVNNPNLNERLEKRKELLDAFSDQYLMPMELWIERQE